MRLLHWTTTRIMDRYRCSCPIHEQLLTGLVLLPQHHILFPSPPLVQLAEAAVLVAIRVCLPVTQHSPMRVAPSQDIGTFPFRRPPPPCVPQGRAPVKSFQYPADRREE